MRGHLGARELGAVALLLILGRLAWIEPTMLVDNPGPSAYLVPLLAFPLGMLALWFAVRAVRTTGDPIACFTRLFGRKGGVAATLVLVVWMAGLSTLAVSRVAVVTRYYFFPQTEAGVILALYMVAILASACAGAFGVGRTARLIVGVPVAALALLYLMNVPQMDPSRLSPFWGEGVGALAESSVLNAAMYWSALLIWLWRPYTNGQSTTVRGLWRGLAIGGALTALTLWCVVQSMGSSTYADAASLLYAIASNIDLGRFLQRLGPLFFFCWSMASILGNAAILFTAGDLCRRAARSGDARPYTSAIAAGMIGLGTLFAHGQAAGVAQMMGLFACTGMVLFPLLGWLASLRKEKRT